MSGARTATPEEIESVRRYLVLLVELNTRLDINAAAMSGRLNLAPIYSREICFFQFRRICEILALGCLILHGDIPETQSQNVRKVWNAEKIMGLLDDLHEHFFPQPIIRQQDGKQLKIEANAVPGALTKADFKRLYGECGAVLHRGSIRSLELEQPLTQAELDAVGEWQSKIIKLTQEHIVTRSLVQGLYMVSLKTSAGGPQCSIFTFDTEGRTVGVSTVTVTTESHDPVIT